MENRPGDDNGYNDIVCGSTAYNDHRYGISGKLIHWTTVIWPRPVGMVSRPAFFKKIA